MSGKREYGSGGLEHLPSGKWRGRVRTPDGRRVSFTRDTEEACRKELRKLAGKVASGAPVASTNYTVRTWLEVWLEEVPAQPGAPHLRLQLGDQRHAGSHWQDYELVFVQPNGRPLDGAADLRAFRALPCGPSCVRPCSTASLAC